MAHHPRRERRRLASASPASCPGAGSVDVTGGTSRHLSTPKRLARVARLLPRPSRRSWRPDPAATHVSAFSEVMGPLPVHASVDSPKPRRQAALRPFSEVRRREPAVVCQQPPVVGSTQLGGHRQSRPRSRRDYRNRGKGIAPSLATSLSPRRRSARATRGTRTTKAVARDPDPNALLAETRARTVARRIGALRMQRDRVARRLRPPRGHPRRTVGIGRKQKQPQFARSSASSKQRRGDAYARSGRHAGRVRVRDCRFLLADRASPRRDVVHW